MIRIGLPPPTLPRLRLHWHTAHTEFARQSRALREYAGRTTAVSRARRQQISEWVLAHLSLGRRIARRQSDQLAAFEEKYEGLIDLICWAAKEGVQATHETRYAELRVWMKLHYRSMRARLRRYSADPKAARENNDPFEALFGPGNVDEVINADGNIENIMAARETLAAYRASLDRRLGHS